MNTQLVLHRSPAIFITGLSLLLVLTFVSGCDVRNDPDIPPFTLAGHYSLPASPSNLSASGGMVAVADNTAGTLVLDAHDLSNITLVFTDSVYNPVFQTFPGYSIAAGIDTLHRYVYTATDGTDSYHYFSFRVFSYETGARVSGIGFSGPTVDLAMRVEQYAITFWILDATQSDGFAAFQICRDNDSSRWLGGDQNCPFSCAPYTAPHRADHPNTNTLHGFGRRDDGMFALAQSDWGVHICDDRGNAFADIETPGKSFDCAWAGNYVVVADEILVSLVDASDPHNPTVASSLVIPSADRLEKVVTSYPYAFVMDLYDGIYVIDISNPLSMKFVQLLSLSQPTSLAFDNGRLYVTDAAQGLMIYSQH